MSAPVSFIECVSNMAYTRVLSCVMLALISSIIASIQLNHTIIDRQENYKRRRLNLSRLLSTTTSTFTRVKRLRCRRESKERRFWTRPGRTSAWWNNFADQTKLSALVLSLFSFGFLPADFGIFLLSRSQQTHVVTLQHGR